VFAGGSRTQHRAKFGVVQSESDSVTLVQQKIGQRCSDGSGNLKLRRMLPA
jgi:hypothetical protein